MNLYSNHFHNHVDAIRRLADAGITPPAEWQKLANRWSAFREHSGDTARAKLTNAIVEGSKADIDVLYALAIAETLSNPTAKAAVRNGIEAAVLRRMRDLYAPHAEANYTQVADLFDSAATKLTDAAELVDVEAAADTIVTASDQVRTAWSDALLAARELDAAVPLLVAAASLAGQNVTGAEALLSLTFNPGAAKRRLVWQAHDAEPGRCGRWSAMLAAGCTIRANRNLTEVEPYRRPKPLEERHIKTGRGSYTRVIVDPEEEPTEVVGA